MLGICAEETLKKRGQWIYICNGHHYTQMLYRIAITINQ